jgi:hypothetical protein
LSGRRVHERYVCELPIVLVHDGQELTGTATNISLGGMYVVIDAQIDYGTTLKARFRLPALKEETECEVVVRWKKPDGVGAQFGSLRAKEVWGLNQFFKGLDVEPER